MKIGIQRVNTSTPTRPMVVNDCGVASLYPTMAAKGRTTAKISSFRDRIIECTIGHLKSKTCSSRNRFPAKKTGRQVGQNAPQFVRFNPQLPPLTFTRVSCQAHAEYLRAKRFEASAE